MNKQITFDIGIKKIKDLSFSVNEEITPEKETGIQITQSVFFNKSDDTITFNLDIRFLTKEDNIEFISSKTSTTFYIPNLAQYESKDVPETYNPPDAMMITIVSLSITHARALIARNALGTKFADIYLPIFDPSKLTNDLFPRNKKE